MKNVEVDSEKIIKSLSKLNLDEYNKEDEDKRTTHYINLLKKEQEKYKHDKAKYDKYENEIKNTKEDLEHKNKILNEDKRKLDTQTLERIYKLNHIIDIFLSV